MTHRTPKGRASPVAGAIFYAAVVFGLTAAQTRQERIAALESQLAGAQGPARVETLSQLTEALWRDDPQKAIFYGEEALSALKNAPNPPVALRVHSRLSSAYRRAGDYANAIDHGKRARRLAETLGAAEELARALNATGAAYKETGEYEQALAMHQRALAVQRERGDETGAAGALTGMGVIYNRMSLYRRALESHREALAAYEAAGRQRAAANALRNIGIAHRHLGDFDAALDAYLRSLRLRETLGDRRGKAATLHSIGIVYRHLGEYERALARYQEALEIRQAMGNKTGVARTLNNMGVVYRAMEQPDRAIDYFRRALGIRETLGSNARPEIAESLTNLGQVYGETGLIEKGLDPLTRALEIWEAIGDRKRIAMTKLILAEHYRRANRLEEAAPLIARALATAQEIEAKTVERDAFLAYANLYAARGDHPGALDAYKRYKALDDALFHRRLDETVAQLETELQTRQKQQRIALLTRENEIQRQRNDIQTLKSSRQQMALYALLATFAVFAALMVLRQMRLNHRRRLAEASAKAKSDFLAVMSHEIRTPMNGVIGSANLLGETDLNDDQRELVDLIESSGENLLSIIDDVLSFAKIEAGKLEMTARPFSPRATIEASLSLFKTQADAKKIELLCLVEEDAPAMIAGDEAHLRQILINLIGNAVKFTNRGVIAARLRLVDEADDAVELQFSIQDTGLGIPKAKQQRLFDAFTQADDSTTRRYGGVGLGLAIAKRLCEMMGGRIWVESEPGSGSIFSFTMFAKPAGADQPETTETTLEKAAPCFAQQTPLRILVAEDNLVNQRVIMRLLQKLGYSPDLADNGRECLEAFRRQDYDLCLMDVQMPEMDGVEATRRIRVELPEDRQPTIVALTANVAEADRRHCLDAGMDDYLAKPVKPAAIKATLRHWADVRASALT